MKHMRITILAITALTVSSAFAQGGISKGRTANTVQVGSKVDPTKRALHLAIEEINKGVKALRQGLPIYQGHRVDAIDYGILAKSEILTGLAEQRLDNSKKAATKKEVENKSAKDYTDQQVKNSNIKLVIGGHHFENALGILQKTNWDYQGHKSNAMVDLQKALDEIKAALAPYGGPQANMPKGGFHDGKNRKSGV